MQNETIYLPTSERFLKEMSSLSKTAIKIYISLSFHRSKSITKKGQGSKINVSHREIRINEFYPDENGFNFFGIANCERAYYRAMKELEKKSLIQIKRNYTKNGKPLANTYVFKD